MKDNRLSNKVVTWNPPGQRECLRETWMKEIMQLMTKKNTVGLRMTRLWQLEKMKK